MTFEEKITNQIFLTIFFPFFLALGGSVIPNKEEKPCKVATICQKKSPNKLNVCTTTKIGFQGNY